MDLPLRPTEIPLQVLAAPGYTFHVEPLTDPQYMVIADTGSVVRNAEGAITSVRWKIAAGADFFADRLRRIVPDPGKAPLTIQGLPFDRTDPAHLASLPSTVKTEVMVKLFAYSREQTLTAAELGSSAPPAPPSSPG